MENNYDYKDEIISSRVGALGGSDGKVLAAIAKNGCVQRGQVERLAIAKGLYERPNITNLAMQYGDFIENMIYDSLVQVDERWESNKCFRSQKYGREGLGLLVHIDFSLFDDSRDKPLLLWVECKATTTDIEQTYKDYKEQLYIEYVLGKELAEQLGADFKLELCHYDASVMFKDESQLQFAFDPDKISRKKVIFKKPVFDIASGMDIAAKYMSEMTEYKREEIDWDYLPAEVQEQMKQVNNILVSIKEKQDSIEEFKSRFYDFLCKNEIKSVKTPYFTISRVDESVSIQFDKVRFTAEHPELAAKYQRAVKKKGYVLIKTKEVKDEK
ncbi:viral recombinase family protein [Bacteroides phage C3_41T2LP]|nr:viral recombinase family protein [Bacteroides phage C3_41T2LP]